MRIRLSILVVATVLLASVPVDATPIGDPRENPAQVAQKRNRYVLASMYAQRLLDAQWYAGLMAHEAEVRRRAEVARQRQVSADEGVSRSSSRHEAASAPTEEVESSGDCAGNWAIPEYIVRRESGCSYSAANPNSSACGAYQIIDGTWDGYGGYSSACDAPPEVQDQKAAELWAGGEGSSHWAQTR